MAYIGNDQVLLFGGWDESTYFNETWVYDLSDNNWTQDLNSTEPTGRRQLKLSETSMDGSSYLILFGGYDGSALNAETWTFGGGDYPLPVKLISFTATGYDGRIMLKWITESELENEGFIILRAESENGDYQVLDSYKTNAILRGAGNSSQQRVYTYIDRNVFNGLTYWYKLVDVDLNGVRTEHDPVSAIPNIIGAEVENISDNIVPSQFILKQNYPNPFNPSTNIGFSIPQLKEEVIDINLSIYSILGQKVNTLFDGPLSKGEYLVNWNGMNEHNIDLPSGIYFYVMKSDRYVDFKKMVKIK